MVDGSLLCVSNGSLVTTKSQMFDFGNLDSVKVESSKKIVSELTSLRLYQQVSNQHAVHVHLQWSHEMQKYCLCASTSKNRGPASVLGSDSGDANALYSAPKHLIAPKFCSKHAHI